MIQAYILSLFLYFPEDKSEYIPASITFTIFLIGAIIAMRLIIRTSKREEKKAKELENQIMKQDSLQKKNS
ncbi:hypothetical protein ACQCVH_09355 [Bacillus infantis]|jgi:preprotein translocase subunit YajC|uniref:hypothetical protein n=1 Tax=Bacillus infantis TaxID=324767 RepID=UPI0021556D48|nr:hypothetical protein [Bacillus infantis]MCR6612517.1 hypothetical protein [Bacillus infantis]